MRFGWKLHVRIPSSNVNQPVHRGMAEVVVASVQGCLVQFMFIFPCMQEEIAQFWHGQHVGEGQRRSMTLAGDPELFESFG